MGQPPRKRAAAKPAAPKSSRRRDDKKSTKPIAAKAGAKIDKRGTPKGKATRPGHKGRGKIGNPPHQPTAINRRIVETHAAVGTVEWAIAEELGIGEDTLRKYYGKELRLGLIRMNARVGSGIAKKALKGEDGCDKFWMSRRGGPAWASKQEISTPPGRPIEHRDMTGLSNAELKILAKIDDAKPSAGD